MTQDKKGAILVPTDFSATTQTAIEHAVHLAGIRNYRVVLLHVINRETRAQLRKENKGIETIIERLEMIENEIESEKGIEVDHISREGSIFETINEVAEEIKPAWMVLGTHGKKGLQYLLGSYALKIITQTKCPVLVVQENSPVFTPEKILFPLNIYTEPRQQVPYAIRAARAFHSTIYIFEQKFSDAIAASKVKVISEQIQEAFDENNILYELHTAEKQANFADQLIDFADKNNVHSILMMTDSSIDNPDFNHTSWSERLIYNHKGIPVFCINPVYLGKIMFRF
jgi:nucleotide-binding universal stress UspA family protein